MEIEVYLRFVAALAFTLGLIGLAWWAARRWAHMLPHGMAVRPTGGGRRLSVVEVGTVDARHRLVLVRRDDVEHLLLIGAQSDLVVESGIRPPGSAGDPSSSFARHLAAEEPR